MKTKTLRMAVRVGFEPTEPAKVQRFSRPPDSTALAPHRMCARRTECVFILADRSRASLSGSLRAPDMLLSPMKHGPPTGSRGCLAFALRRLRVAAPPASGAGGCGGGRLELRHGRD